jgi:hypothetical protein
MTHAESNFNNPVELPSLQEIEAMDKQRQEAIESIEISGNSARCQRCSAYIPIVGRLPDLKQYENRYTSKKASLS